MFINFLAIGGVFDWFWDFLYGISKSIFRIIDGLMECANMLCGVDPITVHDEKVDILQYLLSDNSVMYAFDTAVIIGLVLVGAFSVFGIIKSMVTEKSATPWQIFTKVFKTLLTFLFVPICMSVFVYFSTQIMSTLYQSILGPNNLTIGRFLVGAFSQDALKSGTSKNFYLIDGFNYTSTSQMRSYIELSDFDYIFSWIAGLCILFTLGQTLLVFVDRAISIVLLFIVAPISISTTVIDDGSRFKLWRDQVLVKFITGFGCIIGINIYILVISLMTSDAVVFFPDRSDFLNNLMKIAFILGGAVSMQRIMALVGNLVSSGAGSNELRDNALANAGFKSAVGSAVGLAGKALSTPFRAARRAKNFYRDSKEYGVGAALGSALGVKTDRDYGGMQSKTEQKRSEESRKKKEAEKSQRNTEFANKIGEKVANAISGNSGGGGNNKDLAQKKNEPNGLIMASISGASVNKNDDKKKK